MIHPNFFGLTIFRVIAAHGWAVRASSPAFGQYHNFGSEYPLAPQGGTPSEFFKDLHLNHFSLLSVGQNPLLKTLLVVFPWIHEFSNGYSVPFILVRFSVHNVPIHQTMFRYSGITMNIVHRAQWSMDPMDTLNGQNGTMDTVCTMYPMYTMEPMNTTSTATVAQCTQ